jgi:transposase
MRKKTTNNAVFKKYTLVCAINSKGIVGFELYENGGMNLQRMKDFLRKFINDKYKNNLIIMDNGGSHKSKQITKYIEDTGNKLQYSVPYRPKTNAIENYFSQLKYYFGYETNKITYIGLKKAVVKAMKRIKKIHYLNYINYSYGEKFSI